MDFLSDAELMELVRNGDMLAFNQLYKRYSGPIRKFLYSMTWNKDAADDYLQETFVRLYQARDRYEPSGRFSTYIFQIAKNYYLSQQRKLGSRLGEFSLSQQSRDGILAFNNIHANERVEPEVHLLEEYKRLNIQRAIASLPENLKLVFVMSHIEDMKYAEIADVLGVPIGTVKSRMFVAIRKLRELLGDELI